MSENKKYHDVKPCKINSSFCPKCGKEMELRDRMFHWRGKFFTGYVCVVCNALYDNPEDSFIKHVTQTS